ncbi:carbohydrate sulfotransferase 3-like isoform X2 [Homarus americanus]|uniref:carbohydrate sulfotransferase 3-like isoform X2 n=1 Tax=Homarus americanus TaxID=6706 RepID=UPI001C47D567|nr:carbohydrate sulfotransferase 3-like isoform X2 [Homarus americanus]
MGDTDQNVTSLTHTQEDHAKENVEKDKGVPKLTEEVEKNVVVNKTEGQKDEEKLEGKEKNQEDTQSTCSNTSSDTSSSSTPSSTSSDGGSSSSSSSSSSTSSSSTEDAPRVIHIEDSDKKYSVVEPTKPKTWLAAYNSLAPRTRQTVRTAAIAIISALALVAIFHLAKLAEHPVSENVIEAPSLEVKQEAAAWSGDGVRKTSGGKAIIPSGAGEDWRGGQEFNDAVADAGGVNPVSPVQDILAHARPGGRRVAIRPILNIPVDRNIMMHDVQRIEKLNKRYSRPANSTEVEKTLDLVRKKVEADRKMLTSKSLRLWSQGETPLRVLLVTTWRSGSTFLGQVLANHPGVFHHYEPFSPRGVRQVRSGRDAFQAQQLLHRLLDCQFTGQDEYLNYTRSHPEDMIGHNKVVWEACHQGPNINACYNAAFLSRSCQMFPIQLVKTVRLRLNLTQLFLNDEKMNTKVVFLVRDPRATMSSRYTSVSWCSDKPDCSSPEVLCSDLQADLKVATALRHLYPQRFTMIKYEDIATDPQPEIHRLMDFLGLEYSTDIARYVEEHTQVDVNNPWSTKRKSSDRINMWKKQMPLEEVHTIQNACESVLKTLQYEVVGQ